MRPSATLPLERIADEPTRRSYTVKYLQNLDRLLSNRLRNPLISRMRRRDKSDLPLSILSYKYSIPRYSFSTLSFYSPKIHFYGGSITRGLQELQQRPFFTNPQVFNLRGDGHQLRRSWGQLTTLSPALLPVHPQFALLNIPFSFCSSFYPQKLLGFGQ